MSAWTSSRFGIGSKFSLLEIGSKKLEAKLCRKSPLMMIFYLVSVKTATKYVIVSFESFLNEDQIWNVFYDKLITDN